MKQGWQLKKLGEVCDKTSTIDPRKNPDVIFKYVDVSSVSNITFSIIESTQVLGKDAPSRARKLIMTNDVIFATVRPTLKRIAIVPKELNNNVCSTGYCVLRVNSSCYFRYLYYFLQSTNFIEYISKKQKGASYPAVTDSEVNNCYIPLPPLSEQQRIVEKLDRAFEKIEELRKTAEENLRNVDDLFQASLKQEQAPKQGWNCRSIKELSKDIFAGGDAPQNNFSKEKTGKYRIPIYANAVKNDGLYGFTDLARVIEPSLTIAARGSGTGYVLERTEPYLPIVRLIVVIPKQEQILLRYLYYSCKRLNILKSGSAIPQLTVPMIKKYLVSYPPLPDQQRIVEKLDMISDRCRQMEDSYKQTISLCDDLKQSLLRKAFNGEL